MTDPLLQHIPTPAQIEALVAGFQRVGRIARKAANNMVEAFAAAGRQLEQERRKRPSFTVIVPTEAAADWFGRWLIAPNPVPTYFGRKRRARRARGRRIEARRAWCHGRRFFHPTPEGSGALTVAQWAAAHRTMQRQRMITLVKGQSVGKSEALVQSLLQSQGRSADEAHPNRR
jgi:hypothetical protein